jgi:hypothetical protein
MIVNTTHNESSQQSDQQDNSKASH